MKVFLVVGLGQFGRSVALTLQEGGGQVLAIDRDPRRVEDVKEAVSQAVCMNASDLDALRAVGAHKAQTAVVALGEADLEAAVLTCAALSDLGLGQITVRAANELQGKILQRMGATKVVYPEKEMGMHIAKGILMSGVIDQVTLSTGQTVAQIRPRMDLVGKPLKDAQLRERHRINVIGIQHQRRIIDDAGESHTELDLEPVPDPGHVIEEDDILIVVGFQNQIEHVARKD